MTTILTVPTRQNAVVVGKQLGLPGPGVRRPPDRRAGHRGLAGGLRGQWHSHRRSGRAVRGHAHRDAAGLGRSGQRAPSGRPGAGCGQAVRAARGPGPRGVRPGRRPRRRGGWRRSSGSTCSLEVSPRCVGPGRTRDARADRGWSRSATSASARTPTRWPTTIWSTTTAPTTSPPRGPVGAHDLQALAAEPDQVDTAVGNDQLRPVAHHVVLPQARDHIAQAGGWCVLAVRRDHHSTITRGSDSGSVSWDRVTRLNSSGGSVSCDRVTRLNSSGGSALWDGGDPPEQFGRVSVVGAGDPPEQYGRVSAVGSAPVAPSAVRGPRR